MGRTLSPQGALQSGANNDVVEHCFAGEKSGFLQMTVVGKVPEPVRAGCTRDQRERSEIRNTLTTVLPRYRELFVDRAVSCKQKSSDSCKG